MTKQLPVLAIAFLMLIASACSKEKSVDTTKPAGQSGSIKMKINGADWTADALSAATLMNGYIALTGVGKDGKNIGIMLKTDKTGKFQLDQKSDHAAVYTDDKQGADPFSTNQGADANDAGGSVDLTALDQTGKLVSGTFVFKVYRETDKKQITITDGSFTNIPLTINPPSPKPATGTFTAKIDGKDFTALLIGSLSNAALQKFQLQAADGQGSAIYLEMPIEISKGSYVFGSLGSDASFLETNTTTGVSKEYEAAAGGKLIITEHDLTSKKISGSFEFDASLTGTTKKITSGSFSITY